MVIVKAPKQRNLFGVNLVFHWLFLLVLLGISFILIFSFLLRPGPEKSSFVKIDTTKTSGMTSPILSAPQILALGKPYLLYGTAWKKEETSRLVAEAIESGFRFIDTACQPKHYNEPGVGEGWTSAASKLGLSREDLYLQTKFTSVDGQDPNDIPYDKKVSLETQVSQSLEISLTNLRTDYLDALVLHSPMKKMEDTLKVWKIFESFVDDGKVRKIGISNCYDLNDFKTIYESARIKPTLLQNRFHAKTGFDTAKRAFCKEKNITYQSFWTLTANRKALSHKDIKDMAKKKKLTPQTLMYAFMMEHLGHTPLDGTTDKVHMKEDAEVMMRVLKGEPIFNENEVNTVKKLIGVKS